MIAGLPDAERLIASLPLALVVVGPDMQIAAANPAAEQLLGQSQRRLQGRSLSDILHFAELRLSEHLLSQDALVSARDVGVSINGAALRRLDVSLTPVAEQAGWRMLCLHDASAAESLGDDAGRNEQSLIRGPEVLAHEIKNPLAGIRGAAQLLGRKLSGTDHDLTRLIADEVDRIAKLIDQMQSLSGQTVAPVAPCNLHEVVRRATAVAEAADGWAVRIEEEFDPSLPPVLGNADSLVQVLINLLANAREATKAQSKPRIMVRTRFASGMQFHAVDQGKPVRLQIELRVSDNGPGVSPALRDHIFDPFVTSKPSGQGLGLALVRKLVRDMHGRITHDREEGTGWTHFRVYLPQIAPERKQKA